MITFPKPSADWGHITSACVAEDLRERFSGGSQKAIRRRRYVRRYQRQRGGWPIRVHCLHFDCYIREFHAKLAQAYTIPAELISAGPRL